MSILDEPKIDCHTHILDPARFRYQADTLYRPAGQEIATAEQLLRVMDAYGVHYTLVVGPNSGYGTDNRCLLNALALSQGRFKGIAVVAHDAGVAELAALKAQGIIGVALNPALLGVGYYEDTASLVERLADLDLILQLQVEKDQLLAFLNLIEGSRVRLLIDHCGRPDPAAGLTQPGFQALLALGRARRAIIKLSGVAKFSGLPHPHEDAWPFVCALADAFTLDGCVWGSDWPFLRAPERIDYGPLLMLFESRFPDPADRRKLLWDTPKELLGLVARRDLGAYSEDAASRAPSPPADTKGGRGTGALT
jgi:predicted TIM-barrel fold metal-dependent hydrolase